MRRISSRLTWLYKWVFPALWFGFLAIFFASSVFGQTAGKGPPDPFFFIVPILMAVFGYFLMRKFVFDLVDDAFDDGDTLVVKKRGREDCIKLSDIKNVNYTPMMSPPRVTLTLRKASIFGDTVSFCAPLQAFLLSNHPVIDAWIEHVDAVREARRRSMQH